MTASAGVITVLLLRPVEHLRDYGGLVDAWSSGPCSSGGRLARILS